jgi:hypothetical protein
MALFSWLRAKPDARTRAWYRVALARPDGPAQLVAASGAHRGEAIATARHHVPGSWVVGVDTAHDADIPLGESVGKGHVVELGETTVATPFRWPIGVVPKLGDDAGVAAVRAGHAVVAHPELYVVEAQCDADAIVDLFLGLVERVPAADNLEVRVLGFDDAAATDVWITARVNARKVIGLLDDLDELIENGHLELSVYVRAHNATLRLTEHKTVVWLANDRGLAADVERWLGELAVPRVDKLVTVRDVPHFHYRPVNSRSRDDLAVELYRQRLRRVKADVVKATATRR